MSITGGKYSRLSYSCGGGGGLREPDADLCRGKRQSGVLDVGMLVPSPVWLTRGLLSSLPRVLVGKPSSFFPEDSFIDSGEIDVGRRASQKIPPGTFWRSQVFIDHPVHLKFNVSLGKAALVGIYGRKGLPPSHTQVSGPYTPPTDLTGAPAQILTRAETQPGPNARRERHVILQATHPFAPLAFQKNEINSRELFQRILGHLSAAFLFSPCLLSYRTQTV